MLKPYSSPRVLMLIGLTACSGGCQSRQAVGANTASKIPSGEIVSPTHLSFLTYNVLADPVFVRQRVRPLLAILRDSKADFIALQEVAPWFLARLLDEEWMSDYHWTKYDNRIDAPGGQLILSRYPIIRPSFQVLPGKQRRTVVVAEVSIGRERLAIATSHMESYLEDGPVRAKQLDAIFALLKPWPNAVFLGDFNFGDGEEPDTSHLDSSFADLWLITNPKDPGFTWNMEKSEMAKKGSFKGERSRRLDRILFRMADFKAKSARVVGDQPVATSIFPSDHFGLVGEIVRR